MNKLIIIALALSLAACGHSKKKTSDHKSNIDLTAAGATFPLPYYNLAFKTYKDSTGVSVTYGGIGSGGGYTQPERPGSSILQAAMLTFLKQKWRKCRPRLYISRLVWVLSLWLTTYPK